MEKMSVGQLIKRTADWLDYCCGEDLVKFVELNFPVKPNSVKYNEETDDIEFENQDGIVDLYNSNITKVIKGRKNETQN